MDALDQINTQIVGLKDWRGEIMSKLVNIVQEASPELKPEWKWGTGVWTHNGMVCAISPFKEHVKINFFKGVELQDKHSLINTGFDSKKHRAIDFHEGDSIKGEELKDLVREAVQVNVKNK